MPLLPVKYRIVEVGVLAYNPAAVYESEVDMERQLTDKQMHALCFIYDCIKSNGCAPTPKEIGEALGISSSNAYTRICYLLGHDCLRKSETEQYGRRIALTEKGTLACESFNDNRPAPANS